MALNKGWKNVISRQGLAFYLTLLRIEYKGRKLQKIDSTIENVITYFLSNFLAIVSFCSLLMLALSDLAIP